MSPAVYIDKELLYKPRLPEGDVAVPGMGTVRVRALSRDEVLSARNTVDIATMERRMVSSGMVNPAMTPDEVKRWQLASPAGELQPVTQKIEELSGMTQGAAKEAYQEFEQGPDTEFRVLPSPEAGDDGGPPAG